MDTGQGAGMLTVLLRPGQTGLKRLLNPTERAGLIRLLIGALFAAAITTVVFFLTMRGIRFVLDVEIIGMLLARRLLEFTVLGLFGFVMLSSLATALSTFFLADDLTLLRAAPVPEGPFYTARWVQTAVLSGWMALAFVFPVLWAWGHALDGGWMFMAMLVVTLPPLILIPAALSVLLVTLLVCIFPARRIRELFLVLGILAAAVLLMLFRMIRPERMLSPEVFDSVAEYVAVFEAPQTMFMPTTWAADVLQGAVSGPGFHLVLPLALLWAACWGVGSIGFLIHRRLYRLAYSRAQEGGAGVVRDPGILDAVVDRVTRRLSSSRRAFARKDLKLFLRDPGQWSQSLLLLMLIAVYVYNYAVYPAADLKVGWIEVKHLLAVMNLILAGFVLAALVARFAFPAISVEGRAFWLVRCAPISATRLLAVKFIQACIPLSLVALALVGTTAYWLNLPPMLILLSMGHILLVAIGLTSMGIGMGAIFPRFRFENPAQVPMSFGGVLFMFAAIIYTLLSGLGTAWLVSPLALEAYRPPTEWLVFGWVIWLTFHLAHATIPILMGSRILAAKEYD